MLSIQSSAQYFTSTWILSYSWSHLSMEPGSCLLFLATVTGRVKTAQDDTSALSSAWTLWVAVVKFRDCLHSVKIQPVGCWCNREGWDEQGCGFDSVYVASAQASMGLDTMLFGVSGSCDDIDAASLPVELEPGPPSEKLTCRAHKTTIRNTWIHLIYMSLC